MEQVRIASLRAGARLDRPLLHASGEVLLEAGSTLTNDAIRVLGESGIEETFRPEPGEDPGEFIHQARNVVMAVSELKVGQRTTKPIFDRSGALLAEAGSVVSERMATSLHRRGVDRVFVRKSTEELRLDQAQAFKRALRRLTAARPAPIEEQLDAARSIKAEDCTPRRIDELLDSGGEVMVPRVGEALIERLNNPNPLEARPEKAKAGYLAMYEEVLGRTGDVFKCLENNKDLDQDEVGRMAREVVGGLVEDRNLLLNLPNLKTDYNYLLGHSLGTTILCISVATARGYNRRLVLEMAYAAYLHDIGMLRVPAEIINRAGKLSPADLMQVRRHPIYSLDMLQRLVGRRSGLSGSIPIVAYQSHERENGSGYPKGRSGRVIHEFSKILAICDVYQALTSRRPWREALLPYLAMEQVVLMGSRREVDPEVVRALLKYLSLFPIGSWVELSDGSRGRVVAGNERDCSRPVISIMFRKAARLAAPLRVSLAEHKDVEIVRPILPPEEGGELMEGF